jgi:hypothetical protein
MLRAQQSYLMVVIIILPFYFGRKGLEQRQLSSLLGHLLRLDRATTERSQITSFKGVPLDIRHQRNRLAREQHLPIFPSPPHPDSGLLLEIDGEPLRSNSYVKIEQVRVCTIRALRPHGTRKLTTRSYELLMHYAPPKPPSADKNIVQRHPRRAPWHTEASGPHWIENTPPLLQDHSSRDYPQNRGRLNNTSLAYTQPRRQYYTNNLRTDQADALRQSLLYPYSHTSITPRQTEYLYGTFSSHNQTSRFPTQLSRRPEPPASPDGFPYRKVCAVIILLCVGGAGLYGLFVLARALIVMISQWIHNLLSGKVGAIVGVSFRAAKSITSMIQRGFRT